MLLLTLIFPKTLFANNFDIEVMDGGKRQFTNVGLV